MLFARAPGHPVELSLQTADFVGQPVFPLHDPLDQLSALLRGQVAPSPAVFALLSRQLFDLLLDPALHLRYALRSLLELLHVPAELLALVAVQQTPRVAQLVQRRDALRPGAGLRAGGTGL